MSNLINNVRTINSAVRTVLVLGAVSAVGYGGYFGYNNYVKPSQEAKQAIADLANLKEEFTQQGIALQKTTELNERLETSMKLLKVDRRMANVTVLKKSRDENGNPFLEVSFTEVNEDDEPIGSTKNFMLKGDKFYIDGWVATFEDEYIEKADELRGTSMFAFKSIYGDAEAPRDGQRLDIASNGVPGIYKDEHKREFEDKIWSDFGEFATTPICNMS